MTQIMGVLNVTPDSFYSASRALDIDGAVALAMKLQADGADIIDIGGESTRPGADFVSTEEEIQRIVPVLKALQGKISIPLSVDTRRPEVAEKAIELGASIINDISGFQDEDMRKLTAKSSCQAVVMHMKGTPKNMQTAPSYPNGVVSEVEEFFKKQIDLLLADGMELKNIILDPGIGFGKSFEDNLKLIRAVKRFQTLGCTVLYGVSRKAFIRKLADCSVEEALSPTIAVDSYLMLEGVDIIRVHDVKPHVQARTLLQQIQLINSPQPDSK